MGERQVPLAKLAIFQAMLQVKGSFFQAGCLILKVGLKKWHMEVCFCCAFGFQELTAFKEGGERSQKMPKGTSNGKVMIRVQTRMQLDAICQRSSSNLMSIAELSFKTSL